MVLPVSAALTLDPLVVMLMGPKPSLAPAAPVAKVAPAPKAAPSPKAATPKAPPASSTEVVAGLVRPELLVEVEAIVRLP